MEPLTVSSNVIMHPSEFNTDCACKNALGYETSLKYLLMGFFSLQIAIFDARFWGHLCGCSLDFPSMRGMAPRHWVICNRRFGIVVVSLSLVDCPLIKHYLHLIPLEGVVSDGCSTFILSLVHKRNVA